LELKEIPRVQLHAAKPPLERIFARQGEKAIVRAYREHGYRMGEIAAYLGVHYATVSRRLKQMARK
jgi:putative transposase